MDIWQSADVQRQNNTGWIGRSVPDLQDRKGNVPVLQIGPQRLPLALQGAPGGVVSIDTRHPYRLELGAPARQPARRRLLEELAQPQASAPHDGLLQFVQRRQLQTYATLDRLHEILNRPGTGAGMGRGDALQLKMQLIGRLIEQRLGTRVFYVSLEGFDTHSAQAEQHERLLRDLSDAVAGLFESLERSGHARRVLVMTFSEFGRRVQENGSRGTDHGAASCLFVAGPAVRGGPLGKYPSLKDLDAGDLKHDLDFRRVYATLLDQWLGCDSRTVLGGTFRHVDLLRAQV